MYEIFMQLMKSRKLSAYKVSKDTGITQATLSRWKNGRVSPSLETLQTLADYFDVSLDYLTGNTTDEIISKKEIPADKGSEDEDDDFVVLARHMKKIPEKERHRIIKNFRETVDMYLEVMGITDDKDKEGK